MDAWALMFERIGAQLWTVTWEAGLLILVIAAADRFIGRYSPACRYLLWMIVLVRLMVPVSISLPDPAVVWLKQTLGLQAPVERLMEWTPLLRQTTTIMETNTGTDIVNPVQSEMPSRFVSLFSPFGYAGTVWCAVAGLLLLVITARWLLLNRALRNCSEIQCKEIQAALDSRMDMLGLRRNVSLKAWSESVSGTVALAGVFRPRIVLPAAMAKEWPIEDIEPVLLHELAHVKRADLLINWLQVILQAVYFFHPLVWYANRRIRSLREEACDDLAVAALEGSRKRYVESMLRILEETTSNPAFGFAAMGFSERRSNIGERIRRIMDTRTRFASRLTVKSMVVLVSVSFLAILVSCGVTSLWRSDAAAVQSTAQPAVVPEELIIDNIDLAEEELDAIYHALSGMYDDTISLDIPIAVVSGSSPEYSRAVKNVAEGVERYSVISAPVLTVSLADLGGSTPPVAFMEVDRDFALTADEQKSLERYLGRGGFLYIDNATPLDKNDVQAAVRRAFSDAYGDAVIFERIGPNHPLYHCYFDFDDDAPRGQVWQSAEDNYLEMIWYKGRWAGLYWNWRYGHAWFNNDAPWLKLGTNMVVFAALREGGMLVGGSQTNKNTIEITVVDETTYKVDGIMVAKADLKRELIDSMWGIDDGIIIQSTPDASMEAVIFAMDIGRSNGFSRIAFADMTTREQKQTQLPPSTHQIIVETIGINTYRVDGKEVQRSELEQVLRNNITPGVTNSILIKTPFLNYKKASSFLIETSKKAGFDHISYTGIHFNENGSVEKTQNERVIIEVGTDNYHILGEDVPKERLEQVLRKKGLGVSFLAQLVYDPNTVPIGMLEHLHYVLASILTPGQVQNNSRGVSGNRQILEIDVIDEMTYRIGDVEVNRDDLEQALRKNMDSDMLYHLVLKGRPYQKYKAFAYAEEVGRRVGTKSYAVLLEE